MTLPLQTYSNLQEMTNVFEETDVISKRTRAMQSQYSASPRIIKWSEVFQKHLDTTDEFKTMLEQVFDVDKAQGVFLDWIGKRVGISREVKISGKTYRPSDPTYRKIVKFKMAVNVNRLTITKMNELLSDLLEFPVGVIDCPSGVAMHIKLVLDENTQPISAETLNAIRFYGMIMKPAGVDFDFQITYDDTLGFDGQELENFDHGTFYEPD